MRTRIKFCGVTCAGDARAAAECGADAVGVVLYPAAEAGVGAQTAAEIFGALPVFVCGVALFVNPSEEEVREALTVARPGCLQFHGEERAEFCESFGVPYIKACRVVGAGDIAKTCAAHPNASAVLADSKSESAAGGTGKIFDWSLLPASPPLPLMLAGGLNPQNAAAAVRARRPFAVDVSSGICEEGVRRRKNRSRMEAFVKAVRAADNDRD